MLGGWEVPSALGTTADLPDVNLKVLKAKKSGYHVKLE